MRKLRKSRISRAAAAVAATAVAAALTAGASAPAAAGPGDAAGGARADGARSLTLITGDRVVLDAAGEVTGLIRAPGRESVPVRVLTSGEDTHVIPGDVLPLLENGTLDRRLFNVTELGRAEYQAVDGLPIIVTYEGEQAPTVLADETATTALDAINGEALTVAGDDIPEVWDSLTRPAEGDRTLAASPGIAAIALDGIATKTLAESVPQIGAPEAWEAGYDGEGTTIAVLDTGIDADHPDLAGQVIAEQNFSEAADADDHDGHGTHVASTAAGTGAHSGGTYTGVAPGAELLNGKVLDDAGSGFESDIIEGMEWAVAQGADVVSMSLGGFATAEIDPMEEAVNTLSAESDTLFVIAAGNNGPGAATIASPGTADAALTLGAVDKSDGLADFSSIGPRARDGAVKPDVTAPGVDIAAAGAEGAAIWDYGTPVADGYVAISGTSMATPHAAGAAALVAQAHPDWTGEQIKAALTGSAVAGDGYTAFQQGAGRIDVPAAIAQTVTAEPVSLSFGTVAYPHEDAEPVTRDLTYANSGDQDVTLQLTAAGTDPEGNPAPEGMFALSATEVTVPAGGTATVQATADTTPGGELYGAYSLYVTATGDDSQVVSTAGAVEREEEKFELTVEATGRDGAPAADWWATVIDLETFEFHDVFGEGGTGTVRLPEGEYQVDTSVFTPDDAGETAGVDWLVRPHVTLTEPVTVAADATEASEITMTMPDEAATQSDLTVGYQLARGGQISFDSAWSAGGLTEGFRTAQLGEPGADWGISGYAGTTWTADGVEYHGAHAQEGSFYTGLTDHTEAADLARVTTREGASLPGLTGVLFTASSLVSWASAEEHELPRTSEVYVDAAGGEWLQDFMQTDPDVFATAGATSEYTAYEAGSEHTSTFNVGVFGPLLGQDDGLYRLGDTLYGSVNPFSDGAGHVGFSVYDSASTTLYRNGEELASADDVLDQVEFELPAEEATYELVTTVSRDPAGAPPTASVSTEITASYTFTSAAGPEDGPVPVPVSVVRFTPELALDSTGPAGETVSVPVTVQGAAADGNAASLTVSVSYDGGETWTEVPVEGDAVQVTNPAAGGSVSFRAEVEDAGGNTATQTIIDAYRTA
ncbi:S8 family serine peptidase [Streptomyces litchfieldiae]|uniref:S8 family serine peptidase n=1 Tax=Streptomyces litchfieldiae TaxID=3075543 RepID=A0ABU2MP48_9ACTN|nr:S8 family serine peptidase [Streptomyces sp. DSM 44938]MDT0343397.1 S8 family serine peptidase [Streptomyces sp. DSM 44938]